MTKRYKQFLIENKDLLEFPIKKFMSIIKTKIEDKVSKGLNTFNFDFSNERTLPISFDLTILWNLDYSKQNYRAFIIKDEVIKGEFREFKLNTIIDNNSINYNKLYSIINHELKHVYDLWCGNNIKSFDSVEGFKSLIEEYENRWISDFLQTSSPNSNYTIGGEILKTTHPIKANTLQDNTRKTHEFKTIKLSDNRTITVEIESDKDGNITFKEVK